MPARDDGSDEEACPAFPDRSPAVRGPDAKEGDMHNHQWHNGSPLFDTSEEPCNHCPPLGRYAYVLQHTPSIL